MILLMCTISSFDSRLECENRLSKELPLHFLQLEASTPDQWLSPTDVRDWLRLGADFGQDALSGRPEVVGSGHAVGGVVSAASSNNSTSTIQLQRMISRCACQFVYVSYAPLDPGCLPPGQCVPPLVCYLAS